jgi:subtilisin family serine protease
MSLVMATATVAFAGVATNTAAGPVEAQARSGYIITFTEGTNARAEAAALARSGAVVNHVYTNVFPGAAVQLPAAAVDALLRNPRIDRIEADGVATISETQNSAPWGLDRTDQRTLPLSTSYSWKTDAAGAGVTAYIVDTGVRSSHGDFGGRTATGYTAIADGRGTTDCNGHGTHVAGTVAGTTYGIAKAATVVPVRVLDCSGSGTWSGVIAGLDWIVGNHTSGAAVANMSLGGGANTSLDNAVRRVIGNGVTVVVAAGNSTKDACNYSPARVPDAVTVGSTTSTDARSSFSNFGKCLDLFAPGTSITSAWHTSDTATNIISGTSMASPHAAGVAAVLLSSSPAMPPAEVSAMLSSTATANAVGSAGTGSPNLLLYVDPGDVAPTAPLAPTNVKAAALKNAANVTWTRGYDGGSQLTGQDVRVYQGSTMIRTLSVAGTATSVNVPNLTAGVSYSFTVTATNEYGSSPESARSNTVKPTR